MFVFGIKKTTKIQGFLSGSYQNMQKHEDFSDAIVTIVEHIEKSRGKYMGVACNSTGSSRRAFETREYMRELCCPRVEDLGARLSPEWR